MTPSPARILKKARATGPRTAAGKAASSQNALRHGLASGTLVIPGESQADYDSLIAALTAEWNPSSPTERVLVEDLAKYHWLKDRALRLQSKALALAPPGELPTSFALLLRYQTTNERAFAGALRTLEALQKSRRQFVSQNEKAVAEAAQAQMLANLTRPLPVPKSDLYLQKLWANLPKSAANASLGRVPTSNSPSRESR